MVELSLILVAHRSSEVLGTAITAFRRQASGLGLNAEVVVVEQSEDATEVERAASCRPERLLVRDNRGYAAGINAGIAASRGTRLLIANPDVELLPGALAALLAAQRGDEVVGPQFELAGCRFPPADPQTPGAELARRLATRSRRRWRAFLAHQIERWQEVWDASAPVPAATLSGALLGCSRSLAERVGGWEEGYFLYFEETDWLRRARRAGARLLIVPAARARHRWGHSAEPLAWAGRFATSRAAYFRRHHPLLGRLVLRVAAGAPLLPQSWETAPEQGDWEWLLSPSCHGFPAALAARGTPGHEAAAAFGAESGRAELTLMAWRRRDRALAGPYRWSQGLPAAG